MKSFGKVSETFGKYMGDRSENRLEFEWESHGTLWEMCRTAHGNRKQPAWNLVEICWKYLGVLQGICRGTVWKSIQIHWKSGGKPVVQSSSHT